MKIIYKNKENGMRKFNNFLLKGLVLFFLITLMPLNIFSQAQNIGFGTTSPDNSALLDLTSTTMGFLVPRMTAAQRAAINGGVFATGLLVYQTDAPAGFYYYSGTAWVSLVASNSGWTITGNAGTVPASNFLGTTDGQPLIIKTNNAERIRILSTGETGIGTATPGTNLHIFENNTDTEPALRIEQNGTGNASLRYFLTGGQSVTQGIDNNDNDNFKISNTTSLTGTTYSDANTMMRVHTEATKTGIIDLNHQSRARAYESTAQAAIATATWTQVNFNSVQFDEKSEFDAATNYRFTAKAEGYYQVNARVEFDFSAATDADDYSYVSLAIYVSGAEYSRGNQLGLKGAGTTFLRNNNAPVISDVVYLQVGQYIDIRVYQNTGSAYSLRTGTAINYVSIHKIS